jgi:hypothetical protein
MKRLEVRLGRAKRLARLKAEYKRVGEEHALRLAARLQVPAAEARALFVMWGRKAGRA